MTTQLADLMTRWSACARPVLAVVALLALVGPARGEDSIVTIAGGGVSGAAGYSGDGSPATSTQFSLVGGIAYGPGGDLYIVAQGDQRICRVAAATGIVSTVAGTGHYGFSGDGGPATAADLANPAHIAFDHVGNLLIVDQNNHRIRQVAAATGIITTIAGSGNSSLTPNPSGSFSGDGGPATAATFNQPVGLLVLGNGDLLLTDMLNQRVRRIVATTGIITTVCGIGLPPIPGNQVQGGFSGDGGPAISAALNIPVDLQVDQAGNIFIADLRNNRIRRIAAATGTISTIAGNGTAITTTATGDGGPATAAILFNPTALFIDAHGDLLIAVGNDNDAIRRVDHVTGTITTIAGSSLRGFSGDGGPATQAKLNRPTTMCLDPAGNLVFSDGNNFRVRKLVPVPLLAAEHPGNPQPGLIYSYVEGGWSVLPDFANLAPLATGTAALIDLTPRRRDTLYALRFTGYVFVPADGIYTFSTTSDDGSRLRVGGTLVVDNDGKHAAQERTGTVGLAAGLHALTVDYFQNGGGATLMVTYAGPGVAKQAIPGGALVHEAGDQSPSEFIDANVTDPLVELGGRTYFGATTSATGSEVWSTDGTTAGTRVVADLNEGPADSAPRHLTLLGGRMYFTANDGVSGRELYTSDGTAAGTRMVVDLAAGSSSSNPAHLFALGARLVFSAFQPGIGWRLWASDGSAAGTVLLKDIDPSPSADEFSYNWHHVFCVVGSKLFFNGTDPLHGSALWVTDGTAAGTRLVRNTAAGAPGMEPISMTAFAGKLYYTSRTANSTIWLSDGSDAGTRQFSALTYFNDFNTAVGGLLYTRGTTDSFNNGIWVTDGDPAHQTQLSTTLSATQFYAALGTTVFMNPDAPSQFPYRPLATTTGTPASTGVLAPVSCDLPFVVGSRLFFTSGAELWRSDGTASGTALVTSRIASPVTVGARGALALVAQRNDARRYSVLWASDGTDAGTVPLLSGTTISVAFPDTFHFVGTASAEVAILGVASDEYGGIDHVAFTMSGATTGGGAANGGVSSAPGNVAWSVFPTVNVGETFVTITATSTIGTTASVVMDVVRSINGGPVVAITAPTSGATWTTSVASVPIAGTATGPSPIRRVDYVLSGATNLSTQATGTSAWNFTALLTPGQTRVMVIASDSAGSLATRSFFVTYTDLVPAEHPSATQPGLAYAYAEGAWNTLPDFTTLAPTATGTAAQIDLTPRRRDTLYALRFTGYVSVPADGVYTFATTSDDGSNLIVGGTLVVDNDGKHVAQRRSGTIGLQAGLHAVAAEFFQGGGGATLSVTWSGPGFIEQVIPVSAWSHAQPPGGGILREFWSGVPGKTVASLTSWPAFPLAPSGTSLQPAFVAPSNWADTYGTRMRGYVTAPLSGMYTFWIAGDDQCELWLSPFTGLEQDKLLIATVPSATAPLAWNTFPQQRSATIALTAGQSYYIEALQKEGFGGDCLAVGWQLPDASFERPIPGLRLTPALVGSARLEASPIGSATQPAQR